MRRIEIKVIPRAKQPTVIQRDGELVVRVAASAHDGQANIAVIKLLASHWHCAPSNLRIIRGSTSRRKIIERA